MARYIIVIAILMNARLLLDSSIFSLLRADNGSNKVLIGRLMHIRDTAPIDVVFKTTPSAYDSIRMKFKGLAFPLIYPAISERAWIGVISESKLSVYKSYGYETLGLGGENRTPTVEPRLLPGMRIEMFDSGR